MEQINERSIYDVSEEQINFISEFLLDQCLRIEPNLDVPNLAQSRKLLAMEMANEQYVYFFNLKTPLIFVDLKLLIDGT